MIWELSRQIKQFRNWHSFFLIPTLSNSILALHKFLLCSEYMYTQTMADWSTVSSISVHQKSWGWISSNQKTATLSQLQVCACVCVCVCVYVCVCVCVYVHTRMHTCVDPIIPVFVPDVDYGFLCVYNVMWELSEGVYNLNVVVVVVCFVAGVMLSPLMFLFVHNSCWVW